MIVTDRFDQWRRDLSIDVKCEGCGAEQLGLSAYDDRNFWDNVIPNFHCKECGKSTKDMGLDGQIMPTKYPEGFQV